VTIADALDHAAYRIAPSPIGKGKVDVGPQGGEFTDVTVTEPITAQDWSPIFRLFNLDPDVFEVVEDTVRMSTWQQSARTKDGDRDVAQLYSYSARFRRITTSKISQKVLDDWRSALIQDRPLEPSATVPTQKIPATFPMFIADAQFGKPGTDEAVENLKSGVLGHCATIRKMQAQGRSPERVHLGWMGDETEGVCNNYGNQPHLVELNLSQQLELDYDTRVWVIKQVAELGLPISASSVYSNHGEWTRNGSKDVVTTRADNASTYIARQVKKLFDEMEPYGGIHIDWTIGEETPGIVVPMSGVPVYMSHGYVEKGAGGSTELKTKNAIEKQILGQTEKLGAVPLWFMAHYHHFYTNEFQDRTLFGLPALEAERSSEYMLHQYGVWSPAGMLGLLVGRHTQRGWSDLSVL
jgi:hypothetical protein